jgi:tripartite-type tricarboxylate transporter receptor subunit TctC
MAPAQRDLLAGHIDIMIDLVGNALTHVQDGGLKALAVTSETRLAELGSIPTVAETLPGYSHTEWFAMVAPPKTPAALAAKVSKAVSEILMQPDVVARFKTMSVTAVGTSPEDTAAFVHQQSERWRQVIATTGVRKPD